MHFQLPSCWWAHEWPQGWGASQRFSKTKVSQKSAWPRQCHRILDTRARAPQALRALPFHTALFLFKFLPVYQRQNWGLPKALVCGVHQKTRLPLTCLNRYMIVASSFFVNRGLSIGFILFININDLQYLIVWFGLFKESILLDD